jgi:hypothetical protein
MQGVLIVLFTFNRLLSPILAMMLWLAPLSLVATPAVRAQNNKPLLVVSITGAQELLSDIEYLTETAGVGDVGRLIKLIGGPYVAQLNKSKPAGGYLYLDDDGLPVAVAFMPVTNLKALLATLEDQVGKAEDAGGGILEIPNEDVGQPFFVKESDGWTFVSNKKAHLKNTPKNPANLLGKLPEQYTLAARINMQAIPADARELVVAQMKEGFQEGLLQQQDRLTGDEAEMARRLGESWLKSFVRLIDESDEITVGWEVDAAGQRTYFDFGMTAKPNSELAAQFDLMKESKSSFAGFLMPDAAMTAHLNAKSPDEEIEQLTMILTAAREQLAKSIDSDDDLSDDERKAVKTILGQLLDVLGRTVKTGQIDGGAALLLKPDAMTFVAGGFVADGAALEDALAKLLRLAKEKDNNIANLKITTSDHAGVQIHATQVPLRSSREEARRLLGDPLDVAIGIGKKSAYLAVGKNATDVLKTVIDKSAEHADQKLPPAQITLAMLPLIETLAQFDDNPGLFLARETLKATNGKDKIRVQVLPIKNGISYRLEIDAGVLQVVGEAAKVLAPRFNPAL